MGQKVHPYGFRLGINKPWRSRWFVERDYDKLLVEDVHLKRGAEGKAQGGRRQLGRGRASGQQAAPDHPHRASGHHHRPQGRRDREAQGRSAEAHQPRRLHRHPRGEQAGAGRATGRPRTSRCSWRSASASAAPCASRSTRRCALAARASRFASPAA